MKIAIIGAGLSGLSLAWKLLETDTCSVVLFDSKGIGGGASGIASGLMHPYVGEQVRRSLHASEGLMATRHLLAQVEQAIGKPVARYEGIVRVVQHEEQRAVMQQHGKDYGDVEQVGSDSFLIRSGVTVHAASYLRGLWQMIRGRGGELRVQTVQDLGELDAFDAVVIAAGAGVVRFPECSALRLQLIKGQVLTASASDHLEHSMVGKGYIAVGEQPGTYHLGATYERAFSSEDPSLDLSCRVILPKIVPFCSDVQGWNILECRAGVRVANVGHYAPIATRLNEKTWVLTALGSRGLLYHALFAERLKADLVASTQEALT